jgi:signal transduction histidine kinase
MITVAVLLGVLLMYLLQMSSVRRTVDGQLTTYVTQIEQSAQNGVLPRILAPSTLDSNAEAQVIAADGSVLAATRTLTGVPAVYALPPGATTPVRLKAAEGIIPTDIRVIAQRTTLAGRPVTIITGTGTNLLGQVNDEFVRHLLLGMPLILILAAGAVWLVVGRALGPVERIRHAVTDITSADLSQRVPDPGTPDEVGRLAATMNDMLSRLEESTQRQRRFVADASHELRSPLAAIRTTLEVGLAHPDRAPWPTIAERAAQQAIRLEELIQQLLLLARSDERQLAGNRRPVDLGQLLHNIRASTLTHHIDLQLHVPEKDKVVTLGSPEHLSRLFRNIIDNAVRYADSTVLVAANITGTSVQVEIIDDGPGIPVAERERVFDRFVRLDSSRDRSTGTTGLGLAIAREIAVAHHGKITIADGPSGGARVVVTLPLAIIATAHSRNAPAGPDSAAPRTDG